MDWSSSRFSRRSTDQTCQPGAIAATVFARGTKYPPLAEVPGTSTSTLRARAGPTLRTPTRLYLAGVPGALKPFIQLAPAAGTAEGARAAHASTTTVAAAQRVRRGASEDKASRTTISRHSTVVS